MPFCGSVFIHFTGHSVGIFNLELYAFHLGNFSHIISLIILLSPFFSRTSINTMKVEEDLNETSLVI